MFFQLLWYPKIYSSQTHVGFFPFCIYFSLFNFNFPFIFCLFRFSINFHTFSPQMPSDNIFFPPWGGGERRGVLLYIHPYGNVLVQFTLHICGLCKLFSINNWIFVLYIDLWRGSQVGWTNMYNIVGHIVWVPSLFVRPRTSYFFLATAVLLQPAGQVLIIF